MAYRTLIRIGWRYLSHHPWQSILMIIGISLGVAVVVAIDIANASASRAFDLSTEAITGRATHQITGSSYLLDETVFTKLRLTGLVNYAAPVISDYITSPQLGNRPLQLLGVDPFLDAPFRDYLSISTRDDPSQPQVGDLTLFFTQPGAVLISTNLANQYGLQLGDPFALVIGGQERHVFLVGLLEPNNGNSSPTRLRQRALDGIILTDIASAQELTDRLGFINHIDLILPDDCDVPSTSPPQSSSGACTLINQIERLLPVDVHILPVEARSGTIREMTAAFRLNLSALSLLALIVGMFLIYNTITFSVIQRRPLFGTLRCLGVTRREVFSLVITEAVIAGFIGTSLGLILGVMLGQGAVQLVTQTINDLFFTVTVRGVQIPPESLFKGSILGITATVLTAAPPAWEAASVSPRMALSRSNIENFALHASNLAAKGGIVLLLLGGLILMLPTHNLNVSFTGTFVVILGFALLTPQTMKYIMSKAVPVLGHFMGTLGRMAPRNVSNALSRTSIAVAALMVAISVTIGVSLMIGSFRQTVITWLDQTIVGDIYISIPGFTASQSPATLNPNVMQAIPSWSGIERIDVIRTVWVDSPRGPLQLNASNNPTVTRERIFVSAIGNPDRVKDAFNAGAILISEPLARRLDLFDTHAYLPLFTSKGEMDFPIAGIFYDYSSTQGSVLMELDIYQAYWEDDAITGIGLRLSPNTNPDHLAVELGESLGLIQNLVIRPNQALRADVMEVFDRTFAITGALQLLATLVAFIGILSALLSLHLERFGEIGILRSIGLTVRQLWTMIMVETGLMGFVAGVLAMPTGITLAIILIYIINRRSFGWTLQMQFESTPFIQALAVSVIAALLAGIYPAWKMGKTVIADALRSE
jgi:putative ABC transport system permease protein